MQASALPPDILMGERVLKVASTLEANQVLVRHLESSSDLSDGSWSPVARSLGGEFWESLFPSAPEIVQGEGSYAIPLQINSPDPLFFRYVDRTSSTTASPEVLAARFLTQATFGPSWSEIEALVLADLDFPGWIETQLALPPTLHLDRAQPHLTGDFPLGRTHYKGFVWFEVALEAPDQLRQRMAWALSQIFVIGEDGSRNPSALDEWVAYMDILVTHGLGNFRDLLEAVTLSPKMGDYLTYKGNRKAQGVQLPDENFARELMQLFTIGLWELYPDGTLRLDQSGQPIPTYDNEDILQFARVFTGLDYAPKRPGSDDPNRLDPMQPIENRHDTDPKRLLDGSWLPAGQGTLTDIRAVLDHLFNHPNTAPFISRLLIQRLTISNPSPGYIQRVAERFADNGVGIRGDLAAVLSAILLDREARDPRLLIDPAQGKLIEPLLKLTALCRAFPLQSTRADGIYRFQNLNKSLGQHPYRSFSVFNFYLPDYQAPGTITDRGLFSPEFQIFDDSTALAGLEGMTILVLQGLKRPLSASNQIEGTLSVEALLPLAAHPDQLIDRLAILLTRGTLSAVDKAAILEVWNLLEGQDAETRLRQIVALFLFNPSFHILL